MNLANYISLPTDSLYKFMAISGILILFTSVFLATHFYLMVYKKLLDIKRGIVIHKKGLASIVRDQNLVGELICQIKNGEIQDANSAKKTKISASNQLQTPDHSSAVESLNRLSAKSEASIIQHQMMSAELTADTEELKFLTDQLKLIFKVAYIGTAIGGALAGSGFYLWYIRIQVFLDHALAVQSMVPK